MIFFKNILMTVTFLALASWVVANDTLYGTSNSTTVKYNEKGQRQAANKCKLILNIIKQYPETEILEFEKWMQTEIPLYFLTVQTYIADIDQLQWNERRDPAKIDKIGGLFNLLTEYRKSKKNIDDFCDGIDFRCVSADE